jgi:hypothetical protein
VDYGQIGPRLAFSNLATLGFGIIIGTIIKQGVLRVLLFSFMDLRVFDEMGFEIPKLELHQELSHTSPTKV